MTRHICKQFDADLRAMRSGLHDMGELVLEQTRKAISGLENDDIEELQSVIVMDEQVDNLRIVIANDCDKIIACRQPAARDLRITLAAIRIVAELERIGNEAKKIARIASRRINKGHQHMVTLEMGYVGSLTITMLVEVLQAFASFKIQKIEKVDREDERVDTVFRSIVRQMITFMMEDPRTISAGLDLLFIAKSLERIGDHARNIAEHVIYVVEGRYIKHTKSS